MVNNTILALDCHYCSVPIIHLIGRLHVGIMSWQLYWIHACIEAKLLIAGSFSHSTMQYITIYHPGVIPMDICVMGVSVKWCESNC